MYPQVVQFETRQLHMERELHFVREQRRARRLSKPPRARRAQGACVYEYSHAVPAGAVAHHSRNLDLESAPTVSGSPQADSYLTLPLSELPLEIGENGGGGSRNRPSFQSRRWLRGRSMSRLSNVEVRKLAGLVVPWQVADESVVASIEGEVEGPRLTRRHTPDLTHVAGLVRLNALEQVAGGFSSSRRRTRARPCRCL